MGKWGGAAAAAAAAPPRLDLLVLGGRRDKRDSGAGEPGSAARSEAGTCPGTRCRHSFFFLLFCSNFGKVNAACVQRVTEWIRLEETTAGHRVQPPCSNKVFFPRAHGAGFHPDGSGTPPGRETPHPLWATYSMCSHCTGHKFLM